MSERNSLLAPYRLVDVPDTWWAHAPGAKWAEPDVEAAAKLMRRVWEQPEEARALGVAGRDMILERFSPARTAAFVRDRLGDARKRGAVEARGSAYDARPAILRASQELTKDVGASLAEDRGALPTALVRRFLRRALWPYFEDQRRVDMAVLDALTASQRSIEDLKQRVLRLERSAAHGGTKAAARRSAHE